MARAIPSRMPKSPTGEDPAVNTMIGSTGTNPASDYIASSASMLRKANITRAQRKKKERDAKRIRMLVDLPDWLVKIIEQVARDHCVPKSQVVGLLTTFGIQKILDGQEILSNYIIPSKTPVFENFLQVEGPGDRLQDVLDTLHRIAKESGYGQKVKDEDQ